MAKLSSAELAAREKFIQGMKKNKRKLIKKYGADAEKVMYGSSTTKAKKLAEQNMEQNKLREMVKAALMQPVSEKFPDLTGDGKVTKADILKGRGVDLKEESVNAVSVLRDYGVDDEIIKDFIKTHKNDIVGMNADKIKMEFDNFRDANYDYIDEDLDLGHTDNEPHMLKGDLYRIGKYAMELYQMVDEFEGKGEVDFPHWWQAKIINAREAIESAKHYLDFETKEPEIDAAVDVIDLSGVLNNIGVEDEIEEGLPKGYWSKKIEGGLDESYETLVKKIKGQGKSEKAAKAIAGAVAAYKAKGGGKGPTAKQKAR